MEPEIEMTDADKATAAKLDAVVATYQPMEPTRENVRQAILATAQAFVGIREIGKSNTGYWVNIMHRALGLRPGLHWCMMFIQYVFWFVSKIWGKPDLLPFNSAGTRAMWNWAKKLYLTTSKPEEAGPADILIFADGSDPTGHTELLTAIPVAEMSTTGGNTNEQASRDGGHVAEHTMRTNIYGPWGEARTAKRWTLGVIRFDKLFDKYWS